MIPRRMPLYWSLALAFVIGAGTANATPVTAVNPYHFLDSRGPGGYHLGISEGLYLQYGATFVSPGGNTSNPGNPLFGTVGSATQTGFPGARVISPIDYSLFPNFFAGIIGCFSSPGSSPANGCIPSTLGSWNLTFSNSQGGTVNSTSIPTPTVGSVTPLPIVQDIAVSGGTRFSPTYSWSIPSTVAPSIDAVRVNVRNTGDRVGGNLSIANIVFQEVYPANTTSFSMPAGLLNNTNKLTLEVDLLDLRGSYIPGTGNTGLRQGLMFADTLRQSRAFADLSSVDPIPGRPIHLPAAGDGEGFLFQFNVSEVGSDTIYIDPLIAVGYRYRIGGGDPAFKTVTLPSGIGDNRYAIQIGNPDEDAPSFQVLGGTPFSFVEHGFSEGVEGFSVTGIEVSANVSPFDPTAFVTGLTFVGPGSFTGSMVPIVEYAAPVPEPSLWAMFGAGLFIVGVARARRPDLKTLTS